MNIFCIDQRSLKLYSIFVIFKMQNQTVRRLLPPGVEDDIPFGIMWIRVGALKTTKGIPSSHQVLIRFWGEDSSAVLLSSQSTPSTQEYEIKCPITFFQQYIRDMKNNLKIEVQNLGQVPFDLSKQLKPKITLTSKTPFDHFKGLFDIIGKNQKKVGSLELQMCATFSPEVAIRELAAEISEDKTKEGNQKDAKCKRGCQTLCNCASNPVNSVDILAVQKPELFKQFYEESKARVVSPKIISNISPKADNRLPNSLNNQPNNAVFEPTRYWQGKVETPHNQNFPLVQKILTYSNLKLDKAEQEKPQLQKAQPKAIIPAPQQQVSKQAISKRDFSQNQPGCLPEKIQIEPSKEKKEQKQEQAAKLIKAEANISMSEVSEVSKVNELVSSDVQNDILSRVIHLDQELLKQKTSKDSRLLREIPLKKQPDPFKVKGTDSKNIAFPHGVSMKMATPIRKKSSLLLSMMVEVNTSTIKMETKGRFIVRFRPYGQKQFVKIGPQFEPTTTLIFPLGEPQVLKMNKIPFILEFWSTVEGNFIGMLKISLSQIYKGFVLEGRLNELAIKTSLLPTVIHKGFLSIMDLSDKKIGQCSLEAYIGTTQQMQALKSLPKQVPTAQTTSITKPQQNLPPSNQESNTKGSLKDLTALLETISESIQASKAAFSFLSKNNTFSAAQFSEFIGQIGLKGGNPFGLLKEDGFAKALEFSCCFSDYQRIKAEAYKFSQKEIISLESSLKSLLIQSIKEKSCLGLVKKDAIAAHSVIQEKLNFTLHLLPEVARQDQLLKWLADPSCNPLPSPSYSFLKDLSLCSAVVERVFLHNQQEHLRVCSGMLSQLGSAPTAKMSQVQNNFADKKGNKFSRWFWLHLAYQIYLSSGEQFGLEWQQLNLVLLFNWLSTKKQSQPQDQNSQTQLNRSPLIESSYLEKEKEQDNILKKEILQYNNRNELDMQVQSPIKSQEVSQQRQIQKAHELQASSAHNQLANIQKIQKNSQPLPSRFIQKHVFTIVLQQLHLSSPQIGQCQIRYKFPLEDQQISSKAVSLHSDRHTYKLSCTSIHQLTLSQPISKHFGDNTFKLTVLLPQANALVGDLHPDQLIKEGSTLKVVPLFNESSSGIVGKVKLTVRYSRAEAKEDSLGRQITQEIFLPKKGYLNYELWIEVDENRIRQQFNLKCQFYLQLWLDIFGECSALAPHYSPARSALITDCSAPISLSGAYSVILTPQILQHFRNGQWSASLLMIYYSKQGGNYQKKQILAANLKAPLLSSIQEGGLQGDFALKTKLGMFLSLAHCKLNYSKKAPVLSIREDADNNSEREAFWLLLDFCEVLNFLGNLGWVKFEIIVNGKRLSTDKCLIKSSGFYQFDDKSLCMKLTREEFTSLKILPVKVFTPSQPLALDINLRPIANCLQTQKMYVNAHYFTIVDHNSKLKKIRVGAKLYAFRGPNLLSNFVEALARNPLRSESPPDLRDQPRTKDESYDDQLEVMRKKLKLSAKTLEQVLNWILDPQKKEKLSAQFFSRVIFPSLDLSPLFASSHSELQLIGDSLASEIELEDLLEFLKTNRIELHNCRQPFLQRYKFSKLNSNRLDQNVQYLGLSQQIDLLTLLRKIKIQEDNSQQQFAQADLTPIMDSNLTLTLIRGHNFHLLYNGIKPNSFIKLPQLSIETEPLERNSDPIFNQSFTIKLDSNLASIMNLSIEAYHAAGQPNSHILIGEGRLSLSQALNSNLMPFCKTYRIVIHSVMSSRLQAIMEVKVEIGAKGEQLREEVEINTEMELQQEDHETIEGALRRIKQSDYSRKAVLFEQSDEDE